MDGDMKSETETAIVAIVIRATVEFVFPDDPDLTLQDAMDLFRFRIEDAGGRVLLRSELEDADEK